MVASGIPENVVLRLKVIETPRGQEKMASFKKPSAKNPDEQSGDNLFHRTVTRILTLRDANCEKTFRKNQVNFFLILAAVPDR
jgi:hypothetical protein